MIKKSIRVKYTVATIAKSLFKKEKSDVPYCIVKLFPGIVSSDNFYRNCFVKSKSGLSKIYNSYNFYYYNLHGLH
jgi:hypothetical protein